MAGRERPCQEPICRGGNCVWSPACVASLLAPAREGASGITRHELDALLGADNFLEKDDPFELKSAFDWGYKGYAASMAIAAWISNEATPSDAFLRRCVDCNAHVSIANLCDPQIGSEVGTWISEQTRGLLSPSVNLSPQALACLVSALYLKDAWEDPFFESETETGTFHAPDGGVQVAYMNGTRLCRVIERSGFTAFGLGLSQGAAMLFALPDDDANQIENALPLFEELAHGEGGREDIELSIPRFECETTFPGLESSLKAAGVSTAGNMELIPMLGRESASTQVVHGAKLSVDEHGIEAGAYAMMAVCAGAFLMDLPEPRRIILDRPFYVALISRNGTPLFIGNITTPTEITHG